MTAVFRFVFAANFGVMHTMSLKEQSDIVDTHTEQ